MLAAAWSTVTGFFWRYVAYIALAGFVALAAIAGVLWLQKAAAERKLAAEAIKIERLQTAVDGLKDQVIDRDDAIAVLEWSKTQSDANAAELNSILRDIRDAPATDDGPVSPLLLRALRRVGGGRVR